MNNPRRAIRPAVRRWGLRGIITTIVGLLMATGLVAVTAGPSTAHTQNMKVAVKCADNGVYNITYTLSYDRGVPNGDIFRRTGSTTFQNGWNPGTWNDWTKVATTTSAQGTQSWTIQLPGDTKVAPWEYSYIKWSDGYITQGDTRPENLKGDCVPTDVCPDIPGTQPPGTDCTPPTTDECSDLPGDQPPGFQCEPKSEKQTRSIEKAPNCKTGATLTKYQERTRTQQFVNGQWSWGQWSKWKTVKATSGTVPPGACKATIRAHCVTRHWGEGTVMLFNKGLGVSKRFHIQRSGKDRVVTVGAHKNRRVNLTGLRVGSTVKVKADGAMLAHDKVEGGCGKAPSPHTGERAASG